LRRAVLPAAAFETPTRATRVLFTPRHKQTQPSLSEESISQDSDEQTPSELSTQLGDLSLGSEVLSAAPKGTKKKKGRSKGKAKDVWSFFKEMADRGNIRECQLCV
jgi:hypothetical protein